MIESIIKAALYLIARVSAEQWKDALGFVRQAASDLAEKPGAERKQYVIDALRSAWDNVHWKGWVLDALVGLAYGLSQRKGWIK